MKLKEEVGGGESDIVRDLDCGRGMGCFECRVCVWDRVDGVCWGVCCEWGVVEGEVGRKS